MRAKFAQGAYAANDLWAADMSQSPVPWALMKGSTATSTKRYGTKGVPVFRVCSHRAMVFVLPCPFLSRFDGTAASPAPCFALLLRFV